MSRYLMTATLLNSWSYLCESENGDMDSFIKTLRRESIEQTDAMKMGYAFEEWAYENLDEVKGGVHQAALYSEMPGYLLYGRIDCLRAGTIYDLKYTEKYDAGKYLGSPQTSMYFKLVPEACRFVYIIGHKDQIYREDYFRDEVEPIEAIIGTFESWLGVHKLINIYHEHWRAN